MSVIDRKFQIHAFNPVNGKKYTEVDSLLLCAKDAAVPAALQTYKYKCIELGANPEHIKSIELLVERVMCFQEDQGGGRVPDTIGAEIPRCLNGEGLEEATGKCRQCKAWGSQGMHYVKELTGEYRTCMIVLFGEFGKDTVPMFRLNITFGSGKGSVQTHGDFSCPNFNPEFEG